MWRKNTLAKQTLLQQKRRAEALLGLFVGFLFARVIAVNCKAGWECVGNYGNTTPLITSAGVVHICETGATIERLTTNI